MLGKIVIKRELKKVGDSFGFEEYIFSGDLYLKSETPNGWSPVGEKKFSKYVRLKNYLARNKKGENLK